MVEQAEKLMEQMQRDTAGKVEATVKRIHKGKGGFAIVATLTTHQLRHTFLTKDEWQSILESWQWFITPDLEVPDEEPEYYLVDGVPMKIKLCKDGSWRGYWKENGQRLKKYFGRRDPREKYPIWEREEKEQKQQIG